jgi:hypothetical protein
MVRKRGDGLFSSGMDPSYVSVRPGPEAELQYVDNRACHRLIAIGDFLSVPPANRNSVIQHIRPFLLRWGRWVQYTG